MIGKISQKQYDYWKTKDADEIVDGLHGSHEDEEMSDDVAIDDRFNYMDVFCSSGVYFERFDLSISEIDPKDEDADDAYFCFESEDDLSALGKQVVESVKYPKGHKTFLYSIAEEQGTLLEEEIELKGRFDIKKLRIKIATLPNNSKLIVGIEYDGYTLDEYTDDFEQSGSLEANVFKIK